MNLLTQLLLQPLPSPPVLAANSRRAEATYASHMRGKGVVTAVDLAALTGRSLGAVKAAMRDTLIPQGLVRRVARADGKRGIYDFEWIGK